MINLKDLPLIHKQHPSEIHLCCGPAPEREPVYLKSLVP